MRTNLFLRRVITVLATVLIMIGFGGLAPASAEVTHPRQQWLRGSTAGLFLHWGIRTAPGYTDVKAWEAAMAGGGWRADYWIDEAIKLHAGYVVLASFHSKLGYARSWPSDIPGSPSTQRDYLRELVEAGKARGIKVVLYMTDDPQWHNEGGHEFLDSAAYSRHKGRTVDLTTRDGFGEYSYDNFVEVMQRYPDLAGFWIDNDNAYWERNGLYERIRKERPDFVLSNNNEDTAIMDTISNEQKTGMTPAYDYPQAVYTPAPRLIEACFKLPSSGAWWYTGSNSTVDYKLTLGRLITNAGSSVKALMAETAMVNGRFPAHQEEFNTFAKTYLDKIWKSIGGTEGGGYLHGGFPPGFWNNGAHGVTTVKKDNPNLHYLHVLTKPNSGNTLKLRDAGYQVARVTELRSGKALDFVQNAGYLTVNGVPGWDTYDTVFEVETTGRPFRYPQNSLTATATSSKAGFPAANLVDGDFTKYWDNDTKLPVSIRLDLGSSKKLAYLGINQREWSVSYKRSDTEDSARIKDYRVYVSSDGTNWGNAVASGRLPSARGVQFIDLPAASTRYVRLEVASTWAASTATKFHKKLLIDELFAGSEQVRAS